MGVSVVARECLCAAVATIAVGSFAACFSESSHAAGPDAGFDTDGAAADSAQAETSTSDAPAADAPTSDAAATCWDAVADFSSTSNPNGPWQYGDLAGTTFTPLASGACGMLTGWQGTSTAPGHPPFVFGGGPATCGGSATVPASMLDLHPGQNGDFAVVRWTAPSAGDYTIEGSFAGLDATPTTTDVHVSVAGVDDFAAQIDSVNQPTMFSVSASLVAGETVDFKVGFGANGNYLSDSTGLSAKICR